jgi:hypothetical protein
MFNIPPIPKPPEVDPAEEAERRKEEEVVKWRTLRLVGAGYSSVNAELLARSTADLHRAESLLEKGCDQILALRILL